MEFGKRQTSLLATYSQVTGEYGNKPVTTTIATQVNQPILMLAPSNDDETTASPIRSNAQQQQQQQHPQAQQSTHQATLVESLLNAFNRVSDGATNVASSSKRASCLSNCLLGAALFTSVLNTLLLSFVVKTIQLNDKGLLDGKVKWDEQSASSMLEPPVRMEDKSILLASIVSHDDKPLRFKLTSHGLPDQMRAAPTSTSSLLTFMSSKQQQSSSSAAGLFSAGAQQTPDNSYLAHNLNNNQLELGVKNLVLTSISLHDNRDKANISSSSSLSKETFLLANGEQNCVELPLERKLRLDSPKANSLICDTAFKSPQITGSLEENLDVQTRDGNLLCESSASMKLLSKSGSLKLTTFQELQFDAPELQLVAGKHLYIVNADLRYFNSPADAAAAAAGNQSDFAGRQKSVSRAYNLVAVDGLLMAGSG